MTPPLCRDRWSKLTLVDVFSISRSRSIHVHDFGPAPYACRYPDAPFADYVGPAERSGMKIGSRIVAINGLPIETRSTLGEG